MEEKEPSWAEDEWIGIEKWRKRCGLTRGMKRRGAVAMCVDRCVSEGDASSSREAVVQKWSCGEVVLRWRIHQGEHVNAWKMAGGEEKTLLRSGWR